jgi:hydantoinase/carbamoylase family amidase
MALVSGKGQRAGDIDIDPQRMRTIFDGINRFGRNDATGGYNRVGFSDADMAARHWLADFMREQGLAASWDAAGNLFGRLGNSHSPSVMAGSHTDTVTEGGAFDGTLGVAAALECALAIRDARLPLTHPIEVVDTAEEEGRFGGMLGSQAMAGLVDRDWLARATDPDGVRLWDAMVRQGLKPEKIDAAARARGSIKAFLELHIEQGPVLEHLGLPIGIADRVSGVVSLSVVLRGVANHSGTTPMEMRSDAFSGLAAIGAGIPEVISANGTDQSRITVGKVEMWPNVPHTVPGRAAFSIVLRDTDAGVLDKLTNETRALIERMAGRHRLDVAIREHSRLAPTLLDADLAAGLKQEADRLGIGAVVMASGAGHDAQTMQAFCPSGLIFVPSVGGVSHAPEERTHWDGACAGARLMLAALVRLASGEM